MSPKYLVLVAISLIAIVAISACSDDDPVAPPPDPDILLTLHLGEYFLEAFSVEGIVFASDRDGNLLDTATWSGPATVVLKNTAVHPDTISFTLVQYNDWELVFATELGVPAGTVRSFPGYRHSSLSGSASVTFLNAPDCQRFRLANNWVSVSGKGPLPSDHTFEVYGDSTDLYVRIDPEDSNPLGGWVRSLRPGDADTLDFDTPGIIAPLPGMTFRLPSGGNRLTYNLYGSVYSDSARGIIGFEWGNFEDVIPATVTLFAPEFDPAHLGTMFHMLIDGSPTTFYQQETTGPVPDAFTKMEGELTVTSTSPDSLAFTTTSDYDRFSASLSQQHQLYGTWWVEGPASVQTFALPRIPGYLVDMFPDFPREGFELRRLEIIQGTTGDMTRSQGKYFSVAGAGAAEINLTPDTRIRHSWSP